MNPKNFQDQKIRFYEFKKNEKKTCPFGQRKHSCGCGVLMRYLQIITILFTLINIPINYIYTADEFSNVSKRESVLKVFKRAIELNEDFKNNVNVLPFEEYQKKRRLTEEYHEQKLEPALSDCVIIFSSGNDIPLAKQFFNLLLSFENSADEGLSITFGEIFLNNPDLIIKTFKKFKKPEQKILYEKLQWGWLNVTTQEKIPEKKLRDRTGKMKQIESRIKK